MNQDSPLFFIFFNLHFLLWSRIVHDLQADLFLWCKNLLWNCPQTFPWSSLMEHFFREPFLTPSHDLALWSTPRHILHVIPFFLAIFQTLPGCIDFNAGQNSWYLWWVFFKQNTQFPACFWLFWLSMEVPSSSWRFSLSGGWLEPLSLGMAFTSSVLTKSFSILAIPSLIPSNSLHKKSRNMTSDSPVLAVHDSDECFEPTNVEVLIDSDNCSNDGG